MNQLVKYFLLLVLALGLHSTMSSQTAPGKYWMQFTDKANSTFSLAHPEEYLSNRAIERRIKWNIPLQENDLPVNQSYIDSIQQYGVIIHNRSKWLNSVTIEADTTAINLISQLSFVQQTYKVASLKSQAIPPFSLEKIHPLKASSNRTSRLDYGVSGNQISMLNGDILHNSGYTGEGMVIAVIDAGFYSVDTLSAFDSLWYNHQILGTWDFVEGNDSVFEDFTHGMNVLSILGGNVPGMLIGSAPKASYWLLRSEDAGSEFLVEEDDWIAAAEFADSVGADLINSSLGYSEFWDVAQSHTYADLDGNTTRVSIGADIAASKGLLIVNSAGNQGTSSWQYLIAPSDADSVLAIGACDEFGIYADFSSRGPSSDGRVKPNVVAQGRGTIVQSAGGEIIPGNGTSFSAPVITGLAACLWQANPDLNAMQIMEAIEKSASQYLQPDSLMGYGIPDFAKANLILNSPDYQATTPSRIISLSPNPFHEDFSIEIYLEDAKSVKAELISMNGSIVMASHSKPMLASFQQINFNSLNYLPSGLYLVRIYFNQQTQTMKVMKL